MFFMNDIHMHIIPEVDDGAWSHEMAQDMIRMAYAQGIDKIIATPHSDSIVGATEKMNREFQTLKTWVEQQPFSLKIYQGCEVHCSCYDMEEIISHLKTGVFPTMNGTRYVLTEFYTGIKFDDTVYCLERLLEHQYIPIIAHIERCKYLFEDETMIETFKNMGCLLQTNVYSVEEESNETIKKNANRLLEKQMIDFLGSDAHRTFHRPPNVKIGLDVLYEKYDKEYVDRIAFQNTEELLLK